MDLLGLALRICSASETAWSEQEWIVQAISLTAPVREAMFRQQRPTIFEVHHPYLHCGIGRAANNMRHGFAIQRAQRTERVTRALSIAIPVFAYICR
jgi:hypothetical protein